MKIWKSVERRQSSCTKPYKHRLQKMAAPPGAQIMGSTLSVAVADLSELEDIAATAPALPLLEPRPPALPPELELLPPPEVEPEEPKKPEDPEDPLLLDPDPEEPLDLTRCQCQLCSALLRSLAMDGGRDFLAEKRDCTLEP